MGCLLGDAHMRKTKNTAILYFEQTYPAHEGYVDYLFSIFKNLTKDNSIPKIVTRKVDKRTGETYKVKDFIPYIAPFSTYFILFFI